MNLRYALLGLLAAAPSSGYDVVRRFSQTAGYAWSAHHSQIYPELARCLAEGLIDEVGSGPRGKRIYRTSVRGLQYLHGWLTSQEVDRTVRSEPTLRSFFSWLLDAEDAAAFYSREAEYHRAQLDELRRVRFDFPELPDLSGPQRSARITLERGLRLHAALADWADWAAAVASPESSAVATVAPGEGRQ